MFTLHPQLAADTIEVGNLPLCKVLLMNDSRYPWLILVPQRQSLKDITDLHGNDLETLWPEITTAHDALKEIAAAPKMNLGALGNLVPQLHIHLVARNPADPAWPGPVWGHSPRVPYAEEPTKLLTTLREKLDISAPTA